MDFRFLTKAFFILVVVSFLGGMIGGFLGIGVLDRLLFRNGLGKEVVLQESSVIIDVVEKLEPSVVNITSSGAPSLDIFGREFEGRRGAGTGIVVTEDGLVLTNKHVVPENSQISVTFHDGTVYENVEVVDRDPFNDVAYLRINSSESFSPAELGDSDHVMVGQKVIAIGNVLGQFTNSVTSGIISAIGRPVAASGGGMDIELLQGLLQTDAAINPGNSGGPLVNIQGQVIGMNTAVAGNAEGIGFAIPINQVRAGIESVITHGRLLKPYLGVRYVTLNRAIAEEEGLRVFEGAYLRGDDDTPALIAGGPAESAGLRAGDVIIKIDSQSLDQQHTLAVRLSRYQVGAVVKLTVVRGSSELEFDVTLAEVPGDL